MAELCSLQERRAEKAERQCIELMKVDFLARHTGQTFQASVTSVEKRGLRLILNLMDLNGSYRLTQFMMIHTFMMKPPRLYGRRKRKFRQVRDLKSGSSSRPRENAGV